ncbi:MAG: S26 family signal peptidase [Flavobacteriales bacterium]
MTISIYQFWISVILLYTIMVPWKLFEKAGRPAWEGYIPVYNIFIWLKVIKRPWWWGLIILIPGFSMILMSIAMNVSMGRMFGKFSLKDTLMQIFIPFIYFPMIGYGKEELVYEGETNWENEKETERRKLSDQISLLLSSFGIISVFVLFQKLTGSKDKKGQKSLVKEWGDSIVFALIAASLIRGYVLEAFTIPTPSMEKELLVGDFLFVNKFAYGSRVPLTPLSYPLVHNTIPWTYANSYSEAVKLKYYRLPGFGKVKRNDIVVFNYPTGDTAVFGRLPGSAGAGGEIQGHNYYEYVRSNAHKISENQRVTGQQFINNTGRFEQIARNRILEQERIYVQNPTGYGKIEIETGGYSHRPIDRKENYVKRCVAVPGDTLELIDGQLYIDSKESNVGENVNQFYYVTFNDFPNSSILKSFKENYGFNLGQYKDAYFGAGKFANQLTKAGMVNMSPKVKKQFEEDFKSGKYGLLRIDTIYKRNNEKSLNSDARIESYISFYPNSTNKEFNWTVDNYGPIWMPKEGSTIQLTKNNWILYKRCIKDYEGNDVEVRGNDIIINGEKATSYTFKQNYYYMIGDNRHNSADSRMWGFVPEDHVVGKALIIWMSKDQEKGWFDGGVRWNRIFRTL